MTETPGKGYARTAADAADQRLRGRTYAIPFEDVWQAALRLTRGGLAGWSCASADDQAGVIRAMARSALGGAHDITICISLDSDAQTRVDATAEALKGSDFGRAARRLARFFGSLDDALTRLPHRSAAQNS